MYILLQVKVLSCILLESLRWSALLMVPQTFCLQVKITVDHVHHVRIVYSDLLPASALLPLRQNTVLVKAVGMMCLSCVFYLTQNVKKFWAMFCCHALDLYQIETYVVRIFLLEIYRGKNKTQLFVFVCLFVCFKLSNWLVSLCFGNLEC